MIVPDSVFEKVKEDLKTFNETDHDGNNILHILSFYQTFASLRLL